MFCRKKTTFLSQKFTNTLFLLRKFTNSTFSMRRFVTVHSTKALVGFFAPQAANFCQVPPWPQEGLKVPRIESKSLSGKCKIDKCSESQAQLSRLKMGWGQISCRRRCGLPLTMCVLFMMCFSMINEKHGTSPGYKVARQRQSEKDKCCGITRHF